MHEDAQRFLHALIHESLARSVRTFGSAKIYRNLDLSAPPFGLIKMTHKKEERLHICKVTFKVIPSLLYSQYMLYSQSHVIKLF